LELEVELAPVQVSAPVPVQVSAPELVLGVVQAQGLIL